MSVIVHTGNPQNPFLVFSEATGYRIDDSDFLHVMGSGTPFADGIPGPAKLIATFRHWDSVATVDEATAAAFVSYNGLPCKRCDDRAARLRDAVAAQTAHAASGGPYGERPAQSDG